MLRVYWWDVRKDMKANWRLMPPDSVVKLRSEHHLDPPAGYDVYELVPKIFRKLRGDNRVKRTHEDAFPDGSALLNSVFWSQEFGLPGPGGDQTSEVVYEAQLEDCEASQQEGFKIRCSHLSIRELRRGKHTRQSVEPTWDSPYGRLALGEVSSKKDWTAVYDGQAAVDPRVEITLLQGGALLHHLAALAGRYAADPLSESNQLTAASSFTDSLSGAVPAYFAGMPLPESEPIVVQNLDPAWPLRIEVGVRATENLRAAFAVQVHDTDTGRTSVSDTVFLTSVRGQIIATDLPSHLLSRRSQDALIAVADAQGDVLATARQSGRTSAETWDGLVTATEELGAASVDEAVAVASSALEAAY